MIAPCDARASFDADGETITLQMNFRTIALAENEAPDAVSGFGSGAPKLSAMAAVVWAFAQPAHPALTLDQALALVMRHGEAAAKAVAAVFAAGSAKPGGAPASGSGNPRKKPAGSTA